LSHDVPLDDFRRQIFQKEVSEFQEENYPEKHPEHILNAKCIVFGHHCPVFHCIEDVKEDIECL